MNCLIVAHESPEYWAAVELRRQVLRFPLGMDYTPEQLASESDSTHFAILDGAVAVATAMATPYTNEIVKIRQVAVDPSRQGQGLGRQVMFYAEDWSRAEGFAEAVLHARQVAVDFYLRIGYEIFDEPFEEVGIPHRKMRKRLLL
ncbi:MAG: GNAT family N-acetyltransferase [Armatimonadetes bacterium]|nr:GNAT family N-acetyltransferase [Armatimonadota bacterium]